MLNLLGISVSESAYKVIVGFRIAGFVLLLVSSIIMIICILMQSSAEGSGTNALSGVSETYYAQNKNHTRDGILKLITLICAILIFVISIALIILLKIQAK